MGEGDGRGKEESLIPPAHLPTHLPTLLLLQMTIPSEGVGDDAQYNSSLPPYTSTAGGRRNRERKKIHIPLPGQPMYPFFTPSHEYLDARRLENTVGKRRFSPLLSQVALAHSAIVICR